MSVRVPDLPILIGNRAYREPFYDEIGSRYIFSSLHYEKTLELTSEVKTLRLKCTTVKPW